VALVLVVAGARAGVDTGADEGGMYSVVLPVVVQVGVIVVSGSELMYP